MEYTNIIKTDIVDNRYDVFWEDVAEWCSGLTPRIVLVVVHDCAKGSAADAQLQKMLDACKLRPEQYNVVRLQPGQMAAWHKLRDALNPQIIFMIGIMPAQLGISAFFNLNEPNHFNDRMWLPTVALDELEKHADVKKQLWASGMKPLFVDNPLPEATKE